MAEAMTYSSLVQDIQDYAERDDQPFLNHIPRFIMLAENRLAIEARGLGYQRFATTEAPLDGRLPKPARWRETAMIYYENAGETVFLKQRSFSFLKAYWPVASQQAPPEYYSDHDYEHFLVAPTPDQEYPVTVSYFERPVPLDSTNQTNWTTQYFPQGLLFASLLEAQPFLKRSERTAEFQGLYDRALAGLKSEVERRLSGDQALQRTEG